MDTRKNTGRFDAVFLMTAGVLLAWSLVSGIISTTEFDQHHLVGLIRMFCIVGALGFIFSRKYYVWISIIVCVCALIFLAVGFFSSPPEPRLANEAADFIRGVLWYIMGYTYHTAAYERAVIWALSIAIGLLVVLFGHVRSRFLFLFVNSAVIMGFTIVSPFFSYSLSFYAFVFSILAFLIKHLSRRGAKKAGGGLSFPIYALPLAIICIGLAALFPPLSEEVSNDIWHSPLLRPVREINDIFVPFTGPDYFSLAQTGFGGGDQRPLGGNVVTDYRQVMRLWSDAPLPIYLTGAILDTYTGYSWVNTLNEQTPLAFDETQQTLALYERATSDAAFRLLLGEVHRIPTVHTTYLTWEITLDDEDLEMRYLLEAGASEEEDGRSWWNFLHARAEVDIQAATDYLAERYGVSADDIRAVSQGISSSYDWRLIEYQAGFEITLDDRSFFRDIDMGALETRNAMIGILNNRTHSVFYPDIVRHIYAHPTDMAFLQEESGRLLTEGLMPRHNWYTVRYSPPPTRGELGFDIAIADAILNPSSMLHLSYRGVLRTVSQMVSAYSYLNFIHAPQIIRTNGDAISYAELLYNYLIPRADWIYETYTALPANFPARVRDLAHAITADEFSDFQRARQLEIFLRNGFQYTLTPGPPPTDMDFVEYFLFYGQEGYCTYFATAFVTMARSIGLPARYVEGFMVSGVRDEEGFFPVLNSMGHAWAEVYFEGFGWHRFEPTPAANSIAIPHLPHRPSPLPDRPAMGPNLPPDLTPDEMDDLLAQNRPTTPGSDPSASNQGGEDVPAQNSYLLVILLIATLPIAALVCRVLWVHRREVKAKGQGHTKAVIYYYDALLKQLKFFEFEPKKTETPLQFTDRVAEEFGFPSHTFFPKEIADIFGKARYGDNAITPEDRRQIEGEMDRLAASIESYTGRGRYLFYKYILATL